MNTIKELAQQALDIQKETDIVKLASSVVIAFQRLQCVLGKNYNVANHPIAKVWANKMQELAHQANAESTQSCIDWCKAEVGNENG